MVKKCNQCGEEKPHYEFFKRSLSPDGLQPWCKSCMHQRFKKRYANQQVQVATKQRNKDQCHRLQQFINRVKRRYGCQRCSYDYFLGALEFHHNDVDQKEQNPSTMIARGVGLLKLKNELRKCILLCANCHREVHGGL